MRNPKGNNGSSIDLEIVTWKDFLNISIQKHQWDRIYLEWTKTENKLQCR